MVAGIAVCQGPLPCKLSQSILIHILLNRHKYMKNTKANGYVQIRSKLTGSLMQGQFPILTYLCLYFKISRCIFKVIFCIVFASKPVLKVITIYNTLTLYKSFLLLSLCTQSDIFFCIHFVLTSCST